MFRTEKGECSAKFGGDGGEPQKIDLEHPSQYLTGIGGKYSSNNYVNQITIRSLSFYTNTNERGPYGGYEGSNVQVFSSRADGRDIVGFHGSVGSGKQLASIGFYTRPKSSTCPPKAPQVVDLDGSTSHGPWGGPGTSWSYIPKCNIRKIIVYRNQYFICSIMFKTEKGEFSAKFGSDDGNPEKVDLGNSSEYLTGISGKYSSNSYVNQISIRSLRFYTNIKEWEAIGGYEGSNVQAFSSRAEDHVIVGFHGTVGSGKHLASIGIYTKPKSVVYPPIPIPKVVDLDGSTSLGPWGGPGTCWSYIPKSNIRQIIVYRNQYFICSIMFKTEKGEFSAKFGSDEGNPEKVDLVNSSEYLTGINGKYSSNSYVNQITIRSLSFYTNIKEWEAIGGYEGSSVQAFSCRTKDRVIVGFHGTVGSGKHLASIGIYTKPKSVIDPPIPKEEAEGSTSLGPWGGPGTTWSFLPDSKITHITLRRNQYYICSIMFGTEKGEYSANFGDVGGDSEKIDLPNSSEYLTGISGKLAITADATVGVNKSAKVEEFRAGLRGPSWWLWCYVGNSSSIAEDSTAGVGSVGFLVAKSLFLSSFVDVEEDDDGDDADGSEYGRDDSCDEFGRGGFGFGGLEEGEGGNSSATDNLQTTNYLQQWNDVMIADMPREVGPWGTSGGQSWDDGVFLDVKQVYVTLNESKRGVRGIQFEYVNRNGKHVLSDMHGSPCTGDTVEKLSAFDWQINLTGTDQIFVGIAGFFGPIEGDSGLEGITSITFYTTKIKYGPFGNGMRGTYFVSTPSKGKLVGFHGRNGAYLHAIGVHMKYFE
ncbi:hypothetical protein RJ640_022561 [Escallonia rubra]|uniref:Jacalin-type lectin domain-containing protein n=1 Tax=Escallonia rubra TaxID=112253 RepID=A0AA88ULM1_9ASTE|nr:hypothetical protein RJ640_022561 [Escallonia rubra]